MGENKSVGKNILSYFIKLDETPDEQSVSSKPAPVSESASTPIFKVEPANSSMVTTVAPGEITQEILEKYNQHFNDLFLKLNFPGPDYFELAKAVANMLSKGKTTEDQAFIAIFSVLENDGLTKQIILESATKYIAAIEEDKRKNDVDGDGILNQKIEVKTNELTTLENALKIKREKLATLQKEIDQDETSLASIENTIDEEKKKFQIKKAAFHQVCANVISKIKADIEKVNQLL